MNWTNIFNGEGGQSVRNKINDAMNAISDFINDPSAEEEQSRWEASGETGIAPKDSKEIHGTHAEIATAIFGGNIEVDSAGNLVIQDQAPSIGHSPLRVDSDGRVYAAVVTATPGEVEVGRDAVVVNESAHAADLDTPTMLVVYDGQCDISLEDAPTRRTAEFTVRKAKGTGVVTLNANSIIMDDAEGGVLQLSGLGSWATVKAVVNTTVSPSSSDWWVVKHGGTVQIGV